MTAVCQKLEQVVKRNLAPNSHISINIQKIITTWGTVIKEEFTLKNIHMIHKNDETGLQMLKNKMENIENVIKDAKTAIDDSVESLQSLQININRFKKCAVIL